MRAGLGFLDDYYDYESYFYEGGAGGGGDWGGFDFSEETYGGGGNYGGYGDYGDYGSYYSDQLNFDDLYGGGSGGSDLYLDYLDYYLGQGYDYSAADQLAYEDSQGAAFQLEGSGQLPATQLPPISPIDWGVPYQSYLPSFESPPYTPYEPPAPEPPPLPQSPASAQPNLPPACPQGQYHPFPIGHPDQDACVPFPQQQQRPRQQQGSGSGSSGGSSQSRPQQQQQPQTCPSGFCKHPQTGQCIPIPSGYGRDSATQICKPLPQSQACPQGQYRNSSGQCVSVPRCATAGTVFDARTGRCVPFAQAQQPLCPSGYFANTTTRQCEPIPSCASGLVFDPSKGLCVQPSELADAFADLSKIPWWLWAAGLGAFFLLGKDDDGRKTTVVHRRSS